MWPALLPFPLNSKWKIRSISKVGTQKDSCTSTEPRPYASPPYPLEDRWLCSSTLLFPDPILICGCVHRTGLTNAFTATETKHQLQISIRMLHPHKDAGLRRKQSQGWSESVSWAERPENLWEEEVCRSGKITFITWSHVLDRQSDVSSKAIAPNLCNSKTEKLALESLSPSSPPPPTSGTGEALYVVGADRGQGAGGEAFLSTSEGRRTGKGRRKTEERPEREEREGGIRVQADWGTRQRGERGVCEGFKINCMRRWIQSKSVQEKWLQRFFSPILNWLLSDWIHQIN